MTSGMGVNPVTSLTSPKRQRGQPSLALRAGKRLFPFLSLTKFDHTIAHPNDVAGLQRRGPAYAFIIEERAAGRVRVGEQVTIVLELDARVQTFDGVVAEQTEIAT